MPLNSFQLINKSGKLERIEIEDGSGWHGQFVPFVPNRVSSALLVFSVRSVEWGEFSLPSAE